MRKPLQLLGFIFIYCAFFTIQAAAQQPEVLPHTVLVKLKANTQFTSDASLQALLAQIQAETMNPMFPRRSEKSYSLLSPAADMQKVRYWEEELARISKVTYASDESPWSVAAKFAALSSVEYAEPNFLVTPLGDKKYPVGPVASGNQLLKTPNDSLFAQQQFLKSVMAEEAWSISEGDPSVVIAVADTDVKWDHPDIVGNIWINSGENGKDGQGRDKRSNGVDDDGNGLVDDWHGWDFGGADGNSPDNDTRSASGGHGTAVAGLAGAVTNNTIGIASIANKCKILPIKIGNDAGGNLAFGYQSIIYASQMGARVCNCSWGGFGYSKTFDDAINAATAAGMVVVGGGGNHGGIAPFYPAAYPAVLDAGVCDANDIIQGLSGYGPSVDVITPGQGALTINTGDGYSGFGATSAAAPVASSLCGLVASKFPQYTAEQIRERVRVTCDNIDAKNPNRAKFAGKGRINAFRALSDPSTPSLRIQSFQIQDPNNDRRLDGSETFGISVALKNYLDATAGPVEITIVPVTNAASVQVTKATVTLPAIASGGLIDNVADPFTIKVLPSTLHDAVVLCRIDIKSGTYEDFDFVSFAVNPSYRTVTSNQLSMCIQADGTLGYKDYPTNTQGDVMKFGTRDVQLFLGSALFGTDAGHIVDACRGTDFLARKADFRTLDAVSFKTPPGIPKSWATTRFNDAYADSARKLSLEVKMDVLDYSNRGVNDVVFTKYTITNTGATALKGLRCSVFMDFGGYPNYYIATVNYDSTRHFGYVSKSGYPYVGSFVIDSLPLADKNRSSFWAINNIAPSSPFGTTDGFTYQEKWIAMSSYPRNPTATGNVAYVITAPVQDIDTGKSAVVVFGHTAGASVTNLRNNVDAAVGYWRNPPVVGVEATDAVPTELGLQQSYPNPVSLSENRSISIQFSLPQTSFASLEVFNMMGQRVLKSESRQYSEGTHSATFPVQGLIPGMYVYTLRSGAASIQKKMIVTE